MNLKRKAAEHPALCNARLPLKYFANTLSQDRVEGHD